MMARVLPKDSDLETEAETYNTWHIQDWRKLRRREHGPAFECGGFPWFVDYSSYRRLSSGCLSDKYLGGFCFFLMEIMSNMLLSI
jgi:hypothetical protein